MTTHFLNDKFKFPVTLQPGVATRQRYTVQAYSKRPGLEPFDKSSKA